MSERTFGLMALDEMAEHAEGVLVGGLSWTVGRVRGGGVRRRSAFDIR
jgi:hypothetical protein